MNIPIAVTIDAIEYNSRVDETPLGENPVLQWGGTNMDYNYTEPNGYIGWPLNRPNLHGIDLDNAFNEPTVPGANYFTLDHTSIGECQPILDDAVDRFVQYFCGF